MGYDRDVRDSSPDTVILEKLEPESSCEADESPNTKASTSSEGNERKCFDSGLNQNRKRKQNRKRNAHKYSLQPKPITSLMKPFEDQNADQNRHIKSGTLTNPSGAEIPDAYRDSPYTYSSPLANLFTGEFDTRQGYGDRYSNVNYAAKNTHSSTGPIASGSNKRKRFNAGPNKSKRRKRNRYRNTREYSATKHITPLMDLVIDPSCFQDSQLTNTVSLYSPSCDPCNRTLSWLIQEVQGIKTSIINGTTQRYPRKTSEVLKECHTIAWYKPPLIDLSAVDKKPVTRRK